jgi:hypothetical protein
MDDIKKSTGTRMKLSTIGRKSGDAMTPFDMVM